MQKKEVKLFSALMVFKSTMMYLCPELCFTFVFVIKCSTLIVIYSLIFGQTEGFSNIRIHSWLILAILKKHMFVWLL